MATVPGMVPRAAAMADGSIDTAAGTRIGTPAIERYGSDLEVYPRNFAVTQGPSGIVYVGNAEGVLSFDGTRWRLHATNEEKLVRTLAHDGQGRLYVGGYNGFGYFETPLEPASEYVDLTGEAGIENPDFADIWQLEISAEGVFFLALNTLFRFDPETREIDQWEYEGRFGALAEIDGEVYVQFRGEGMRAWRNGDFEPVPGTEALSEQLYDLIELPDGGFITTARNGRWLALRNGEVETFDRPEGLPRSSAITASATLDNGLVALGSDNGWLHFLDPGGKRLDSFRLAREWIAGLHATAEGGLIAQTDHETLYIRWPAKWTSWGFEHGLNGNVLEILDWRERWLVISNGGAFISGQGEPIEFQALPWTDFEAWDLLPLGDGTGLFADSYTVKHVDLDGVIQELESVQYPRVFERSSTEDPLFLVGTEDGLSMLRRGPDGFAQVLSSSREIAPVFSIVEMQPGRFMLGTQGDGVFEVRFDERLKEFEFTDRNEGIEDEDGEYVELQMLDGALHALTENSIWRWNGARFEPARIEGLDQIRAEGRYMEVRESPSGDLWAFDFNHLYRNDSGGDWKEMEIGPLYRGALSSLDFGDDGRVFAGASGSVAILDPDAPEMPNTDYEVMLRSVELDRYAGDTPDELPDDGSGESSGSGSGREVEWLDPGKSHAIPAGSFSIRFDYALPGVSGRNDIRYKARLKGYEQAFTGWESTSHYTYFNLEPGHYAFEVQARAPDGRVTEIEPFEFRVVPPWHQSPWILNLRWPGVAVLLGLLIWAYMRARVWRLEAERKRLATKVRQRTQALVAANRKLKQMAEIDELTGIANRRSFDQYLRQQIAQCHAGERPLALALIDLDQFKPYNDRYGHLAGDRALRDIAGCLTEGFGDDDTLVARFGGDEFVAVLPGRDLDGARALAERAREWCAGACGEVELSIGIAAAPAGEQADPKDLLEAADHQLYEIKRSGRNGVKATWVKAD